MIGTYVDIHISAIYISQKQIQNINY